MNYYNLIMIIIIKNEFTFLYVSIGNNFTMSVNKWKSRPAQKTRPRGVLVVIMSSF